MACRPDIPHRIAWTEETWNPIRGCSKVSAGCAHCYAETMAARFSGPGLAYEGLTRDGRWNGTVRLVPEHLEDPLRWKRPRRVFVNSMSDLFHENLPEDAILKIFEVMVKAVRLRGHTFQILTKRAARMQDFLSRFRCSEPEGDGCFLVNDQTGECGSSPVELRNMWFGVSVEDQASADERIPLLLRTPVPVRWLSMEPLLGPVDLTGFEAFPEWIVVAGESGQHARPMAPDWVRSLRDQCEVKEAPFFFKQWGEWITLADGAYQRIGKREAGRLLDGILHDAYPAGYLK